MADSGCSSRLLDDHLLTIGCEQSTRSVPQDHRRSASTSLLLLLSYTSLLAVASAAARSNIRAGRPQHSCCGPVRVMSSRRRMRA